MTHKLTQKERLLLEDQKKQEELCIQKYRTYASQVKDPQLKQLLETYAQQEQQHLDSVNQMLSGNIPSMSLGQSGQQQWTGMSSTEFIAAPNPDDALLLNDLLMTEKYVSSTYNTAIFEFTSTQMRQVLNHIQTEEQQHGEGLYNYMHAHGMYDPQ